MPSFDELLDMANASYAESTTYSDWMPPVGKYLATVDQVRSGQKDGSPWWSVTAKLVSGLDNESGESLEGKVFSLGFFGSKNFGMMKSLIKRLTGSEVNDLRTAHQMLTGAVGTVIEVTVKESKDGQYTNAFVDKVVEGSTPAQPQE